MGNPNIGQEGKLKGGPNRQLAAHAEVAPHLEALNKSNISKGKFEACDFVAQLVEFSHTRSGDVLVKIRIPYIYRDQPSLLKDAYGLMLQVHMQPWSQAEEARRLANE